MNLVKLQIPFASEVKKNTRYRNPHDSLCLATRTENGRQDLSGMAVERAPMSAIGLNKSQ